MVNNEYIYANHREQIFTDEGQREFLKVRDKAKLLLKTSGVFMMFYPLKELSGNSWNMMAYVDRLVELGEIKEIHQVGRVAGQRRIFVGKNENGDE